jgi:hypothetical protein
VRDVRFRPQPWIVSAILGLTLAGACDLNPHPLPPENGGTENPSGDDGTPTVGAGASSGSGGNAFGGSSGAGTADGGGSGLTTFEPGDGGANLEVDAAVAEGGASGDAMAADAATDGGPSGDSGSDGGGSPDASLGDASLEDGSAYDEHDAAGD